MAKTANLFEEPLSGAEVLAHVDNAIMKVAEVLASLKTIRAGIGDLSGLDAAPKPLEPVKKLLLYFDHQHKETFKDPATGEPVSAVIAWGKDNVIMKRIREAHGDDRTERLIDLFFEQRDEYCERNGYTVQTFSTRVGSLVARTARQTKVMGVTRATESNARNAEAAVSLIQQTYGGNGHRATR
jgi:hypothetical protein